MDTVGAIASSDDGNASSDDGADILFAIDDGTAGLARLEEAVETGGTKNTAALMRAERNRAFYDALDKRMDLLIRDVVQP